MQCYKGRQRLKGVARGWPNSLSWQMLENKVRNQETRGSWTLECHLHKARFYYYSSFDNRVMSLWFNREAWLTEKYVQGYIKHKKCYFSPEKCLWYGNTINLSYYPETEEVTGISVFLLTLVGFPDSLKKYQHPTFPCQVENSLHPHITWFQAHRVENGEVD